MSTEENTSAAPTPPPPSPTPRKRPARSRRTAVFIAVFACSVFALLTGYRYLIGTPLNDWYLYRVASDTATALRFVGEMSTLENTSEVLKLPPNQVRATLAAWKRGAEGPAASEIESTDRSPLSTWEQYEYRLSMNRRMRPNMALGPRVFFVLRWSDSARLFVADQEMKIATERGDDKDPAKQAEFNALKQRVDELRAKMRDAAVARSEEAPGQRKQEPQYFFIFIVISECGAIEVMAIFFSAVFAFPTTWRKRIIGLICGLPLMYLLNIGRLTALAVIGSLDPSRQWFNFFHEYVWQAVYIVFVVIVWMIWIEFVVRGKKKTPGGQP